MFMLGLLSPLLIDAPIASLSSMRGDPAPLLGCILFASAAARFGLLAIWLAWGATRAVWRLPLVLPGIILPVLIWTGGRNGFIEWRQVLSLLLMLFLGTAALAAVPRLFGAYRINLYDSPTDSSSQRVRGGQFGLLDIFAWTATVAVLAGIVRWVGLPRDSAWPVFLLIALPITGIYVLTAIWAVLTKMESIYNRAAIAGGITFVGATVLCLLTSARAKDAFYIHFMLLLIMALLIGGLYLARSLGVRLTVRESPMPNTLVVARQNETSPEGISSGLE
jgi:hypothetical protein